MIHIINIKRHSQLFAWLIAFILLGQISSVQAKATLNGIVRKNTDNGPRVKNVWISDLVTNTNGDTTDTKGLFTLKFPEYNHAKPYPVEIIVDHPGWVVVNRIQLKMYLPADPKYQLTIIICKEAEYEDWAMRYYRLQGRNAVDAKFNSILAKLDKVDKTYASDVERLTRERDQAKAQVDEMARDIARTPVEKMNESYQQAMRLFLDGKIDEALAILSEEVLKRQTEDVKKQQDQVVQNWLLRGKMLATQFDFDNATRMYSDAVKFFPDSFTAWFAFSTFHHKQKHFKDALKGYKTALALAQKSGNSEDEATTLNHLGTLYYEENSITEAQTAFGDALILRRNLAVKNKNQDLYLSHVAATLNNLGNLHSNINQMDQAMNFYSEALTIRRKLAKRNPELYLLDVAKMLNNLGLLHHENNQMDQALQAYEEALNIYGRPELKNSENLAEKAMTLRNLGNLYLKTSRTKAQDVYMKALEIYQELAKNNPDAYLPEVAMTKNNLGILYSEDKSTTKARDAYMDALKLFLELEDKYPNVYSPPVAQIHLNLGILYSEEKNMTKAREAYMEALKRYRILADKGPNAYLSHVAITLNNLGNLYSYEKLPAEARQAYEEALNIYRSLDEKFPGKFNEDLHRVESRLSDLQ